jgi:serine/threonine protein kinase
MNNIRIANKYEIREKIGQGVFGSVFLGEKVIVSGKKVAIKIEKEGMTSLRNESRILEFLARNGCGKHIAQVFWYGIQEKYSILVMTYIDGISLADFFSEPSRNTKEKVEWFLAAIQILEQIHSVGVIHRDIKPAHFLFWKETWYLIDFGFSTFSLDGTSKDGTSASTNHVQAREYIIGTPNYISIDIHNGFSPTARDDIISLVYIFLEIWEKTRLPWSKTILFPTEEMEKYPECHILHIQNQYKKKYKEKWEIDQKEIDQKEIESRDIGNLSYECLQEIYINDSNSNLTVYKRLINRIINNINNYV